MKDYLELQIKQIKWEAPDAATYILESADGQEILYKAGQFLTLLLAIGGKELRRSYSLSSASGIDSRLAITIKRVSNGEVSRYLLDNLKEGDILKSLHPAGRFTIQTEPNNSRDIFLIGAGSGMIPLFSLLKTILAAEPLSKVTLIDSNKNESSALFWEPLGRLEAKYPNTFTAIHLFSNPAPESKRHPVRLNIGLLQELITKNLSFAKEKALFFVCGPFHFMRMVRMTLVFMGFDENQIYKEIFVTDPLPGIKPPIAADSAPKQVKIILRKEEFIIEVPYDKSILQAALDRGIQLPYSCFGGVCSTCIGKCTSGSVKMAVNEVLTDKDIAQGWVLTCVGYPVGEGVVIEFGNQ